MESTPNVLAARYASKQMRAVWSAEGRIALERDYWIAVLRAQKDLGLDVPQEAIDAYERVKGQINLDSINEREAVTRHDVKARIEEFCDLAGHEHIHKGLTSRDLTENVEQLQIIQAMELVRTKAVAALLAVAERAEQWKDLVITARTHNVPAQPTTFGKRLAMFGEDLLIAVRELDRIIDNYPVRGLKGPVGTQMDLLTLFGGDQEKVAALEERILDHLGVGAALDTVGQVYPRGLDFEVVSVFVRLASGPSSFAKTLRIMAGHELASEGFSKGQVGSSAMPHKMNSRSCERLNGFAVILKGYLTMAAELSGDQWNEGDVSCSVVRRVFLPDSFYAIDGLIDTFLTILNQMEVYPAVIDQENQRYGPFLATTTVLMEAVKAGAGREEAHEAIKEHAVQTVRDLRSGLISSNDLVARLAGDARLGLSLEQLTEMMSRAQAMTGLAATQVNNFCAAVREDAQNFPGASDYKPGAIL
ncbi:MAG: adenylosuccinate lyase [Opitutales bacterium]|jgi:adenylosuccinate lyase|nr:adenylosuccinate lyase [Opitutales bacterium]MDP4642938.1 adenylosuccinate lyase [Opitutales bacterium]MDP4776627.1 adenylosuccinate lyase [Opitutales bacterium]MDP4882788.1 adenylosuccinate lyase [Opitutales bacterium]MDP5078985.1 adenylosuccinate lyase [Opitutales bacterium]